ncbi:hypothetical protein TNCV_4536621 [Trichonephila clavipes]|nr:hypothetical protein TNCV_4536621 [Trichonephila clavipes]
MEFENLAKSDNYNQNVSKFLTDNGIKGHPNVQELGWSYQIPFKEERKWSRFIDYLAALNNISIDRCIVDHRARALSCMHLATHRKKAYGSSIYLKSISTLGEVKDDKGVLRVGGKERWLEKASIPYSQKHPTILAKKSKLSKI